MIMWIIQSILLGISLAMDACAISMSNGLVEPKMKRKKIIFTALLFGLFQGGMPLLGYLFGSLFKAWISNAVPIIGFLILSFIGGKMIYESRHKKDEEIEGSILSIKTIVVQGIATSIDALTVGIVYVGAQMLETYITFLLIAVITFGLCLLASFIGRKFGDKLSKHAEVLGGVILILIGLKMIIEYLVSFL